MACKSAYIAATLNATAASEFFTQDLEDEQSGDTQQTGNREHWCAIHKTPFFMKGKMKAYAHPIKDKSGNTINWCNEKKEKNENETTTQSQTEIQAIEAIEPIDTRQDMEAMLFSQCNTLITNKTWDKLMLRGILQKLGGKGETVKETIASLSTENLLAFQKEVLDAQA